MAKYVLIGGGDAAIFDREIVRLSQKSSPCFLWIGFPNKDFETKQHLFQTDYGCDVDSLVLDNKTDLEIAKNKIRKADILYIADVNALHLMRFFRKCGIDRFLQDASKEDKVFCGVGEGAGSMCRFVQSCKDKIQSCRVTGLGLIELVFCPHVVDESQRTGWLKTIMKRTPRISAVSLDHAALVIDGDRYRVVSIPERSRARKCYWFKKQYFTDNIKSNEWHLLDKLKNKVTAF